MKIVIIAHNIRSTHNIGAILRTADGFGIAKVYCTGYTPYPTQKDDDRLPHLSDKITRQIHKTALNAEKNVDCAYAPDPLALIEELKANGYQLVALEQSPKAISLPNYQPQNGKIALLLGEEVAGVNQALLSECQTILEIPMTGQKESFNVSVAAGIAMYALTQLTHCQIIQVHS